MGYSIYRQEFPHVPDSHLSSIPVYPWSYPDSHQQHTGFALLFPCSLWLSFSSQLATSVINLIHFQQQAIFSYLVDEHVVWNRVRSLSEVKIFYVSPCLPTYKVCHSVRGGNWIGPTWFVGCKVKQGIAHHPEPFQVLANWLGTFVLWLMHFLSLFRTWDIAMQSWTTGRILISSIFLSWR